MCSTFAVCLNANKWCSTSKLKLYVFLFSGGVMSSLTM